MLKGEINMDIKELSKEFASLFEELAELRERARKLTRGSDE